MKTKLFFFILIIQLLNCQKIDKRDSAFQVQISQPNNKYHITPVFDKIKTLEGSEAGLPYGSTSGSWGDSGKGWTEQYGTPIGADIVYYSRYEDIYYHLDIDFPLDKISDYMERAYPAWDDLSGEETKEYKRLGRDSEASNTVNGSSYDSFTTLVFGFAPQGMVVVWFNYGNTRIEFGRYQAKRITDAKEIIKMKDQYMRTYRISPERYEEARKELNIPNVDPSEWDNYRQRYNWRPVISSENPKFELMEIMNEYYNGEKENMLRPWVADPSYKQRAISKEINVFWQTGKQNNERKQANFFLNWAQTNEAFRNAGQKIDLQIKISEDNQEIQVFLNDQPLKIDSIRIFPWSDSMLKENWFKGL